jgi:hypothetical protein
MKNIQIREGKVNSNVIRIDNRRFRRPAPSAAAQGAESMRNPNQHERTSLIRRFIARNGVRTLAKSHPGGERGVEQVLRDALLEGKIAA